MSAADKQITEKGFNLDRLSDALIQHAESAIVAVDLNGTIAYWNPGAEKMFGYTSGEAVGSEYNKLIPADRAGEFRKVVDKVRHARRVPAFDTLRKHKDGSQVAIHLGVHPITEADGQVVGICTVSMDISKLKETEHDRQVSKSQIEAVVHTVLDGIVTINERGIIDSVNPATQRIFGYHDHEMIGCNVKMLMPEPYHSEHDGYLHNYMSTGEAKIIGIGREVKGKRKDGSTFPIDLAVTEMSVGGGRAFVGILRDITERKAAEDALHQLNQQYAHKAEELAATVAQLQETQHQLVQSEKLASLGGLVAGVAHEINTPVGVCVTATSYLQGRTNEVIRSIQETGTLPPDALNLYMSQAAEAIGMITNNLERAAQLINSFKQVSADRSNNELRQFDLKGFLEDLVNSLQPVWKRKGHVIEIICDGDKPLNTYPGALSQIGTNLIMNSVTHAYKEGKKGHMKFHANILESEVEIAFSDDGCGIPPENMNKIFDPFFTTSRVSGGTGLGLHVVHNLVNEVLDGKISVASEPGKGSTFTVIIPRLKGPEN